MWAATTLKYWLIVKSKPQVLEEITFLHFFCYNQAFDVRSITEVLLFDTVQNVVWGRSGSLVDGVLSRAAVDLGSPVEFPVQIKRFFHSSFAGF